MRSLRTHLAVLVLAGSLAAPPAARALSVSFQVASSTGGSNLPYTIGHAFKQGDVPTGSAVVASAGAVQVVPKNLWPDGSLKFAIVSGTMTLAANTPGSVTLSLGTAPGGSNLTTSDLRATNVTASIGAGSFGSVSWSGPDWDSPFMSWVGGPVMSSWIYRKPIGSDPHLVAWLEVRLYAGGAVEVLPWVENGYLRVAGPTDKNATYTFTLGGTQRFSQAIDLLNHQRMVLASGSIFSHWLGADPQITPRHDVQYLMDTKMVPLYGASPSGSSALWTRITQTYTPLAQADENDRMGAPGYHGSIGPLPEWDVAYLTSGGDPRAYRGIIVNTYCHGRYGIHFRDETTNRPPRFSSCPNLVLDGSSGVTDTGSSGTSEYTPTATGTGPPAWANSHHPAVGYFAYLVTGRFYCMEETEFLATAVFLKQNTGTPWDNRQGSQGIINSNAGTNTTRGAAWGLRTLIHAATITPDADPLRAEYVSSWGSNVDFYYGRYVAQPNNPQGFCQPYEDLSPGAPPYTFPAWEEDFLTFAFGFGRDLVPLSAARATKLDAFMVWKYRSIVGRLGGSASTDYCFRDLAQYLIPAAPVDNANWQNGTGPWYADWGQLYVATVGHANDCASGNDLRGTSGGDPLSMATGYWGNLRPAISYAVDQGAAGADVAYARLTGASNYAAGAAGFDDNPVWSVRPRSGATPPVDTVPPSPPSGLRVR